MAITLRRESGVHSGWSPFQMFVLAGLIGLVAIGAGSYVASQRSGRAEAFSQVRTLTAAIAKTVVEPNLSANLLAGDPDAVASLDEIVNSRVLDETTVRVKLWDATGRIVYSDALELIGEQYELDEEKLTSLRTGEVVSEISSLGGPENRFEIAEELLEVYLPLEGPGGEALLYESYFATSVVSGSANRIRSEFLPIVFGALLLMEILHLAFAFSLSRRTIRAQAERESLLRRAIESSDMERRRIASDLHDGVVQDLVGASFAVAAAAESARSSEPRLAEDLRIAAAGTRRSVQSLRSLLIDIYPPNLREQGLESALSDLLAPAAGMGIQTRLTISGDPDRDVGSVMLVYRVVQEAVRNALRHAGASTLTVAIEAVDGVVTAIVRDDGRGFVPADRAGGSHGHLGLRILTDLTADAGGRFAVESAPGDGTAVELRVPA